MEFWGLGFVKVLFVYFILGNGRGLELLLGLGGVIWYWFV